jgi:hypothetical protein
MGRDRWIRPYLRTEAVTPDELISLRCLKADQQGLARRTKFTCDSCAYRYRCTLVFDEVNVGGRCLVER